MKSSAVVLLMVLTQTAFASNIGNLMVLYKRHVAPMYASCVSSSGVNPQLAAESLSKRTFPDNKDLTEYWACIVEKLAVMDRNGKIDWAHWRSLAGLSASEVELVYQNCKDVTGTDFSEKAYGLVKCCMHKIIEIAND